MAVRKEEFNDNDSRKQQSFKRSRITFDVSPELRRRIKVAAAQSNLSLGAFLGRIVEQALPEEIDKIQQQERPMTRRSSERLRRIREKILADRNGKPFEDSAEMIRQMREERAQYLEESQKQI